MIKIVSWDAVGIRNEFFDCFHNSQADIFCARYAVGRAAIYEL